MRSEQYHGVTLSEKEQLRVQIQFA